MAAQRRAARPAGQVRNAAVVAHKEHQRIFHEAAPLQFFEDAAHALVHAGHHGAVGVGILLAGSQRGELLRRNMLGDLVFGSLERRMGRIERHVEEERPLGGVPPDAAHGLVSDQVGRIALVAARLPIVVPIQFTLAFVGEVIERAVQAAVKMGESAVERIIRPAPVAQMPLADDRAVSVPVGGEHVGQSLFFGIESVIAPGRNDGFPDAETAGITPGHQPRTGRRTDRSGVETVHLDAPGGQRINVGRGDDASVIAHVAPAQVVGHDEQDVRAFAGPGGHGRKCGGKAGACSEQASAE